MKKVVVIVVIAVLVMVGGIIVLASGGGKNSKDSSGTPSTPTGTNSTSQTNQNASKSATPISTDGAEAVTVKANDQSATPEVITVKKGDKVTITFTVLEQGTYHGGLQFTSIDPAVQSGAIKPGDSGDVTFTATKSFDFTPYWYQSGVKKDYVVAVKVQ
jgi:FtsP/CotA-like multicopper oxidase with cupredoxin domain